MVTTLRSIPLLLLVALACRTEPAAPAGVIRQLMAHGLEQTVRIAPAEPAPGDTLVIRSVVANRGTSSPELSSRICGLDLESAVRLDDSFVRCAGYSMLVALAPGDSLTGVDQRVVAGPAGSYTLRVRHLLNPDTWVEVPLVVR